MEPYRLPLARKWISRPVIERPHHDYPATDIYVPYGTKSFAVQAGKVRATLTDGRCGIGVVIDGFDGFRYTYCHGSEVLVDAGRRLKAGEPVMRTGTTGSAWGRSHLHLEIEEEPSLTLVCPQPLMVSWWRGGQKTAKDAPYGGCSY